MLLALYMMSHLEKQSNEILHVCIVSFNFEKLGNLRAREPVVSELLDIADRGEGAEAAGVA